MWWRLGIGGGIAGLTGLVWAAARTAAALTSGTVPGFSVRWATALIEGDTAQTWPGTPTPLVLCLALAMIAFACGAVTVGWRFIGRHLPQHGDPVAALRRNPGITPLTPLPAAQAAARLRSSLAGAAPRRVSAADTGLVLGSLMQPAGPGPVLFASWEDTIVAFMAPRSGKTTALGIPHVLSAPGPVVATSIKADLWAATAQLRGERGGTVWLFDPQHIACQPQEWWWDPLQTIITVEAGHRMSAHFVLSVAY